MNKLNFVENLKILTLCAVAWPFLPGCYLDRLLSFDTSAGKDFDPSIKQVQLWTSS